RQNIRKAACRNARPAAPVEHRRTADLRPPAGGAESPYVFRGRKTRGDGLRSGLRSWSLKFGLAFHLNGNHSFIVEGFLTSGMFRRSLEERFDHAISRNLGTTCDDFLHSGAPEHVSGFIAGIENTVAEEHEHVTR